MQNRPCVHNRVSEFAPFATAVAFHAVRADLGSIGAQLLFLNLGVTLGQRKQVQNTLGSYNVDYWLKKKHEPDVEASPYKWALEKIQPHVTCLQYLIACPMAKQSDQEPFKGVHQPKQDRPVVYGFSLL